MTSKDGSSDAVPARWEPEIDFGLEQARVLLATQFPELDGERLEFFGEGWDNLAVLVADEWVFRFPRREIARAGMEHESAFLPRIASRLPLAVPDPRYIGRPQGSYPFPFSGYRMLPGRTACRVELNREAAAAPLGRFLRALHDVEVDDELEERLPLDLIRRADLEYRLGQVLTYHEALEARGLLQGTEQLDDVARRLARASSWCGAPRPVHGDLYARHLLVDAAGALSGVIDWGDVHRGDPALDLSIAFAILPPSAREGFFAAYGDIDRATEDRARFRAIFSGLVLVDYGNSTGDMALEGAGRTALRFAVE